MARGSPGDLFAFIDHTQALEFPRQQTPGATEARLDGADRTAERNCDFLRLHFLDGVHQQHRSVFGFELVDDDEKKPERFGVLGELVGPRRLACRASDRLAEDLEGCVVQALRGTPGSTAKSVGALISSDAAHPAEHGAMVAQARKFLPRAKCGLLNNVLGFGIVAKHGAGKGVDDRCSAADELAKGLLVGVGRSLGELCQLIVVSVCHPAQDNMT